MAALGRKRTFAPHSIEDRRENNGGGRRPAGVIRHGWKTEAVLFVKEATETPDAAAARR
jgi:hypothetical protein